MGKRNRYPHYKKREKGEAQALITRYWYNARSYIGYCHNKQHKGYVTVEALACHHCLEKECWYLQKYEEHAIYFDKKYFTKRIPREKLLKIKMFIWGIGEDEAKQCTQNLNKVKNNM